MPASPIVSYLLRLQQRKKAFTVLLPSRLSATSSASKDCSASSSNPIWKGPGADSEEKREPVSDIDIAVADSLKVLDPKWPIREADIAFPRAREPVIF
jgi:hypothetical protein